MSLRLIASYDDLAQLCGLDTKLAEKYSNVMEKRDVTFDPVMACASNPDLLVKGHFFSRKGKECKRGLNTFDSEKFTRKFIKLRAAELAFDCCCEENKKPEEESLEDVKEPVDLVEDTEESKEETPCECGKAPQRVVRSGFDAYSYLMAYEREVNELYKGREDLSKLQKAALYFVESGAEEKELDYMKYLASYDDLSIAAVQNKPLEREIVEWLPEVGKMHFDNNGRNEIMSGARPVNEFFNATKYIASYPQTYDSFKSEDGSLNEVAATLAWITFGVSNGFARNQFSPMVYLANNPDLCKEDIYENGEVDENKVAKKWLDNYADGIDLASFDVDDFKESNELREDEDPFKVFVDLKVKEYKKQIKKDSKVLRKLAAKMPGLPKLSMPSLPSFGCGSKKAVMAMEDTPTEEAPVDSSEPAVEVPAVEAVPEPVPEPEPEPELSLEELKQQLKETKDSIEVFDTMEELEAAKKKLDKLKSKKR